MILRIKFWLLIYFWKTIYGYTKVSTKCLYAQAKHETADFKSEVFIENKNLFGMRQPKIRKNRAIGSNKLHAVFPSHNASIIDYFLRQKYFKIPNTNNDLYMVNTLNSNYAEDKNYLSKWQNHLRSVKVPAFFNIVLYGGLFFLLLVLFFFPKPNNK
jgi:uncharacterized FlgJ-related protein